MIAQTSTITAQNHLKKGAHGLSSTVIVGLKLLIWYNLQIPGKRFPMKEYIDKVGLWTCLYSLFLYGKTQPTVGDTIPGVWGLGCTRVKEESWVQACMPSFTHFSLLLPGDVMWLHTSSSCCPDGPQLRTVKWNKLFPLTVASVTLSYHNKRRDTETSIVLPSGKLHV